MKTGGVIAMILIVVLVIAAGIFLFTKNSSNMQSNPPNNSGNSNNPSNTNNSLNNPNTNSPSSPKTFNVVISGFAFSPSDLSINSGDTVIWTNQDSVSHTITSDSGTELSSSKLLTGGTYSHTFNTNGTYNYHCSIHTSMKGTVTVGTVSANTNTQSSSSPSSGYY